MNHKKIDAFRFGVLVSKGKAEIHTLPLPAMNDDAVLVKQLSCNICTADYTVWMGQREGYINYPMSGGHEGAGVIEAIGNNVKNLKPGDFVAIGNNYCGKCQMCQRGRTSECLVRSSYDVHGEYFGRMGFADYFIRPETTMVKMSHTLLPEEAGFLEPVATVVKGMTMLNLKPFDRVVIIGGGTMGQLNALVARAYGAKVILCEIMEKKLRVAERSGIATVNSAEEDPLIRIKDWSGGEGADIVIVAVGSTEANRQAAAMLKRFDGKMLIFAASYPAPEIGLTANDIHYRRMSVIGTYIADINDFLNAADLLNNREIRVSQLIEANRYRLDEIQKAFEEASAPGKFRVCVRLHEE